VLEKILFILGNKFFTVHIEVEFQPGQKEQPETID
jgi:hypothetical protein